MVTRRTLIGRIIAGSVAAALPTGHVAAAIAAPEPEIIPVAPGLDVIDGEPYLWAQADSRNSAMFRTDARAFSDDVPLDFSIKANGDGSGALVVSGSVDRGSGKLAPISTTIKLNAEAFRPIWELVFAQHYRITEAVTLTRHPWDFPITSGHQLTPAEIDWQLTHEEHTIVYGGREGSQKIRDAGFDRVMVTGGCRDMRWFAVRTEPAEPHWADWLRFDEEDEDWTAA